MDVTSSGLATTEPGKGVIRETDAEAVALARSLLRTARYGALAAAAADDGWPMATRTALATDMDGSPLILVSTLSSHTQAITADSRCSVLVGEPGKGDPLAHPRMTLFCLARRLDRQSDEGKRAARRYLARHPKAKLYADFADFSFFRLEPVRASLNGGFGRAYMLTSDDLVAPSAACDALAAVEEGAVGHMNRDHRDAIAVYANAFAYPPSVRKVVVDWTISGLDPDGLDLVAGDLVARVAFPERLSQADALRQALIKLAEDGRAAATRD